MSKRNNIFKIIILLCALVSIPTAVYYIGQKTYFFNRAYQSIFGTKADFIINLTDSYKAKGYSWSNLAQGGEEKEEMLNAVRLQVKKLEPSYIRIDHVYDFYEPIKRDASGNLVYNWEKLDREIEIILSTGAKPHLSLSYMPPALSSGSEVDLPQSWNDWKAITRETIEHVSGKDGLAIENVYYEVWNEPDLFGEFTTSGTKNYLTLYKYASLGAGEAKNVLPYKIGGPATTALYESWFKDFFKFIKKENLQVDFYSWHRYSKNIANFDEDVVKIKKWLLEYPEYKNIEFIISESGHNSENDAKYDNEFSAIHTVAIYTATFQRIPKIFTFEIKDGPGDKQFWGRWGLLTHESFGIPIEKPRYKSIEFLNRMKGEWYSVLGEGTWVKAMATTKDGTIRVLIVNYDQFGKHIENVPIHFINIPYKIFTVRRIEFLGETQKDQIEISGTQWSTTHLMQPNSAVIIEITPLR